MFAQTFHLQDTLERRKAHMLWNKSTPSNIDCYLKQQSQCRIPDRPLSFDSIADIDSPHRGPHYPKMPPGQIWAIIM